MAHQAQGFGLGGVQGAAGEKNVCGFGERNLAGQADR